MHVDWITARSTLYTIVLHIAVIGLLLVSIKITPYLAPAPSQSTEIIKTVTVDNKQVERELQRLKDINKEKQQKQLNKQKQLERKLAELQQKAKQAEKKRKTEEQKLAGLKKKKVEEKKQRDQEQKKLARIKKEKEELQRKMKLKEAEDALQKKLAEQQRQQDEVRQRQDQKLLRNIVANVYRRIVYNFNKSGLPDGLECILSVRVIPGGEVINVTVSKSSGNEVFDRRALVAVQKASPLPLPEDVATFERLNLRHFNFRFRPEE